MAFSELLCHFVILSARSSHVPRRGGNFETFFEIVYTIIGASTWAKPIIPSVESKRVEASSEIPP